MMITTLAGRRAGLCAALAALALAAGCDTLSKSECQTADWRAIGVADGSRGQRDRAAAHLEACSQHGLQVDVARYRAGRDEGLQRYCTYDNALAEGLAGRGYEGVCPPAIDSGFRYFHGAGSTEFNARKQVADLRGEQDRLERELRNSKTSDDRKRDIRRDLARMDRRIDDARDAQQRAEAGTDRARADLRNGRRY